MLKGKAFWALSGFLGLSQDWDSLSASLGDFRGVDLSQFPCKKLKEWGKEFNRWIAVQHQHPDILMGYSLGGRLALHALIDNPFQWKAAVVVSAHPGLPDANDRVERLKCDASWAYRFGTQEWCSLMEEWNNQTVFKTGFFHFDRRECDYERQRLVDLMMMSSLGQQEDLLQEIAELPIPILWITGECDTCYTEIARRLTFRHPHSRSVIVEGTGHRVPWEAPCKFIRTIKEFLDRVDEITASLHTR